MITVNGCENCTHIGLCKYEDRMKEAVDQMSVKNLNDGLGIPDFLQVHVRCKYFIQKIRGGYILDPEFTQRHGEIIDC